MEKDLEIDGTVTDKGNGTFEAAPEIQEIVENNMAEASLSAHHSDFTSEVVFWVSSLPGGIKKNGEASKLSMMEYKAE